MLFAAPSPPRLVTLVFLTALSIVSLNMFLPSLSHMAADFRIDYALMTLSIGGYLGIEAVLMLVLGPLSDRFGRRPVLLAALAIFTAASLVCATTSNIWIFLTFRVFQGTIIAGWGLSLAVIRDTVPTREAASKIGYLTMAMAVGPMLGPLFGGVLDQLFGWRANFVVFAGLGAAALGLCWLDLGETNKSPSETLVQQIRTYPALLRSGRFWGYALCRAFSTGAFYAFLAGAPLVAVSLLGLSPATLGFYMGTITAGFALGSFLAGRLATRYALTTMMISGRLVACTGLVAGLGLFLGGAVHVLALFGPCVLVGLGNGVTMPSCNAGALSVRPDLAGSASGLAGALTVGVGAALTSVTGWVVTEETGAFGLLGTMLAVSLLALFAALSVAGSERRLGRA
jgi:DHA1 family bicyclomycin/chloramphenicol resistance-like MFS transporter